MNWPTIFDPSESSRLCLTLLHSTWQFALVAITAALFERVQRRPSVERSYVMHVGAFVVGLLALPITYLSLQDSSPVAIGFQAAVATASSDIGAFAPKTVSTGSSLSIEPAIGTTRAIQLAAGNGTPELNRREIWLRFAPWLAGIYVGGVVLMLIRLANGLIRAERLRAHARPIADGPLVTSLRQLSRKWSLRVAPLLAQGEQIVVPKVIGLLKPTILVPASALSCLSTGELELILAHELAHIRRHDMWVNLLQRLAEAVLFFNPAMWYLSRRIGTLREYCCDELACRSATTCGVEPRMRYATALLRIVELAKASTANRETIAALAASGRSPSELRRRVARLFGEPVDSPVRLSRGGVLTLAAAGLFIVCGSAIWPVTAQTTETVDTAEQENERALKEAAKEYSFGGTIEVLAIGTHDETPQRWWDTNSELLESVPFTWCKQGQVTSPDKVWRRIVFHVDKLPQDAGVEWHLEGARASAGGMVTVEGERNPRGYLSRYFAVADDLKSFDLRVGVATGPWKTAVSLGGSGMQATGGTRAKSLVSSGAVEIAGGTAVFISHNYNDQNYRVIAIDKQGKSHDSVFSGGASAGEIIQTRPTFPGLKAANIDRFEFQVRDYEWIELNKLPINPGNAPREAVASRQAAVQLDESPEAAQKRQEWLEKLARLTEHNQTAFAVGPLMIFELPADDAFEVIRHLWPKVRADEVKTGLLKTFEFARHPRVLDVLDLGARDESREVREYAYAYLQNYAMRDFKLPEHDYATWRRQHAGQPVDQVLQTNTEWFVASLRDTKPVDDDRWWLKFDTMLNIEDSKSSYPSKAKYLRDAGLLDVLQKWHDDPAASDAVKHRVKDFQQQLRKASLAEDESHEGANLHGEAVPGLVLNKAVPQLFAGANLRECDLSGSMLIGGIKAFYDADLSGANLSDATLIGQAMCQAARFDKAILTNAVLRGDGADFQQASFDGANLRDVRMSGGGSSFQEASFRNADLTAARLQGGGSSFQLASFDDANLRGATIVCDGVTAFQAVHLNNADFSGADLSTINPSSLESCEFARTTPPKYSAETKFPAGFDPARAGWRKNENQRR
jgi:beta-lactamase regulating signal transducer with metallopeptidase domain/uncharacterized protein YjbI with pentapeptide repeats